jgi:DNA end-binding protein Ku
MLLALLAPVIDAATPDSFDLRQYKDSYTEKVRALIEAKVEGRELVAPPTEEPPPILNLMDALKESVARAKKGRNPAAEKPPAKGARGSRKRTSLRRKTS